MVERFHVGRTRPEVALDLREWATRLAAAVEVAGTTATGTEVRPRSDQIIPVLHEAQRIADAIGAFAFEDRTIAVGLVHSVERIARRLAEWIDPEAKKSEAVLLARLMADLRAIASDRKV